MRRINRCLNRQLLTVCQQAIQLDEISSKLHKYLPENLRNNCRVGSFNKGCLILVTNNAIWATELRYCLPTLRDSLRRDAGLYQLTSIKINIMVESRLNTAGLKQKTQEYQMSDIARDTLSNVMIYLRDNRPVESSKRVDSPAMNSKTVSSEATSS